MPRKLLRRWLPAPHRVRSEGGLHHFGDMLANPDLWQLNRKSVARAGAVGLFLAFVPVPGQMLLAAGAAIWLGINLPVAVVMVWVSNPLTLPFLFYAAYRTGAWLLDSPHREIEFEISWRWLASELSGVWEPFLLGSLILGLVSAAAGYLLIRLVWRLHVLRAWHGRNQRNPDDPLLVNPAVDHPRARVPGGPAPRDEGRE